MVDLMEGESMTKEVEYFRIGKFVTTRGLKGDLKVYSYTDNIDRFSDLKSFYIGSDRSKKYEVEKTSKIANDMVVIKIKSYDTIESVQGFIQKDLYVDRSDTYDREEDEMLIVDMIGMRVETLEGELIGDLEDVLQYAANDVYVVKSKDREYLIPATYEIVPEIDKTARIIRVKPIPGLLD